MVTDNNPKGNLVFETIQNLGIGSLVTIVIEGWVKGVRKRIEIQLWQDRTNELSD